MLKVIFKRAQLKQEVDLLLYFCTPDKSGFDWSKNIYKAFPSLEEILKTSDQRVRRKRISEYAKYFTTTHKDKIDQTISLYQKDWSKINDDYLHTLSKLCETTYPKNKKVITAFVSIIPIYPRFLDTWEFNVDYAKISSMRPIAMHEILHFFYFKKWMEVFPKTKKSERDAPHLVWKLSEILAPIIINNSKEIQRLHKHKQYQYTEFADLKVGTKKLVTYFEDCYRTHVKTGTSFEEFLKSSLDLALKYEDILGKK